MVGTSVGMPSDGERFFPPTIIAENYHVISYSQADSADSPIGRTITSINFYRGESYYSADLNNGSIKIFDKNIQFEIVEFDMKTKKLWWYLDHRCNQGVSDSDLVNMCLACDDPKIVANFWNNGALRFYGRNFEGQKYSKKLSKRLSGELSQLLSKSIPEYMSRYYDSFRKDVV